MIASKFAVDPVLAHAAAAAIGAVLILGGISKLRDVALFKAMLDNYRLLWAPLLGPLAWALPFIEILSGILLLPDSTRKLGAVFALCVLVTVSAAVLVNVIRDRTHIECGCDTDEIPVSKGLLFRNLALMLLCVIVTLHTTERAMVWLDLVSTLTGTLFLLGLYKAVNLWLSHQSRLIALRNAP